MTAPIFKNNATSRLNIDTASGSATLTVFPGEGAKFPDPVVGTDHFMVTIEDRRSNQIEICKCTDRNGDILVVTRAQEGTTAKTFLRGATVSNRFTAGTMAGYYGYAWDKDQADARFVQQAGDTMDLTAVLSWDAATPFGSLIIDGAYGRIRHVVIDAGEY
jgi:hypothetical protein